MPHRTDINNILVLGAGPIVIGQACEFDYSGVQACRALKEEGYRVILVNSNPATVMTDPDMADATYIEPIRWQTVAKIIEQERPDALLATMGGQTALNCALDLHAQGILERYQVEMIGANADTIDKAENRHRFDLAMQSIGLETPRSALAHSMSEAFCALDQIGFPCIIRPSFTMGGEGGGIAYNRIEFEQICTRGLELSPVSELLIDESRIGWKEYELEVVRDCQDNCIVVCAIENFDPMGVHTGDSITVAPPQTLTDKEYQQMRNAAVAVLREIGVETGGSNVQFGVNPEDGRMVVIEMNPRVSRSSALASKATGFPIARVAAKLAVGYTLDELQHNSLGGMSIPASFEPTLDYVVTKLPRFSFEKFPGADRRLTTQMKSVGEVMAIGRTFQESLHKALRGLEVGAVGLDPALPETCDRPLETLRERLSVPTPERIWYVADAFRHAMTVAEVASLSRIDHWFLVQIKDLVDHEQSLLGRTLETIEGDELYRLKRKGFSDARLACLLATCEQAVREKRKEHGLRPVYKRVDSCAAEFPSATAYLYSTYENECEAEPEAEKKIVILGGGPNRIGQGIEFDYCCVHASIALAERGYQTIMVNCNPETVSTDADTSDRLYFEPVTLEDVLAIVECENPDGVIVQYGGQTPLGLALALEQEGVPVIGTSPKAIDRAENRELFGAMIARLELNQPCHATARSVEEAIAKAASVGYPLVVRPSYVLGGRAMEIVSDQQELTRYMHAAVQVGEDCPVLLDQYLSCAVEVDVDAVCDGRTVVVGAIMQHIEQAGIHSGDSGCSLPPYDLSQTIQDTIRSMVKAMALELDVRGLMNVQLAIQDGIIYVLEVNPRASRTVPFVSKAIGLSLAKVGARVMAGESLAEVGLTREVTPTHWSVKEPVLPFHKFPGVDPVLGPEMKSTGEVMGIGASFAEAYAKGQLAAKMALPYQGQVVLSVRDQDKNRLPELGAELQHLGFRLFATRGTAASLQAAGIEVEVVNKVKEGQPHLVDMIVNGDFVLVVNTTEGRQAIADSSTIRRAAMAHQVLYTTTMAGAKAIAQAIAFGPEQEVRNLQNLHKGTEA